MPVCCSYFLTNYAGDIKRIRALFYSGHTCLRLKFDFLALGDFPLNNGFYLDSVRSVNFAHANKEMKNNFSTHTLFGLYENKNIFNEES